MEEEEKRIIYQEIFQQFFMQSDAFLIQRWNKKKKLKKIFSEKDRTEAYQNFYQKVKKDKIANRQTIRKWFGLGGKSIPNREHIFRIAFSLGLSVDETEEYLKYGISEPDFQINDYSECITMYCLDHDLDYNTFLTMTEYFEMHMNQKDPLRQTAHTDYLKKTYALQLRKMSKDEFLSWMCKNSSLFKGYSLNTLETFQNLIDKALSLFRDDMTGILLKELEATDFYLWAKENHIQKEDYGEAIPRYIKNEMRHKNPNIPEDKLSEIRYLLVRGYSSRTRITDLLTEMYDMINLKNCGMDSETAATMEKEIGPVSASYISELQKMAVHKEKMIRLNHALAQLKLLPETDPCPDWICEIINQSKTKEREQLSVKAARSFLEKIRALQGQRTRNVSRSDLLIPLQYISYKNYQNIDPEENPEYSTKEEKEKFIQIANKILNSCGMRKIDPMYRIDYVLLSCFKEQEVILFSEIFEQEKLF